MTADPLLNRNLYLRLFSQDVVCFQRHEVLRAIIHRYVIGYILLVWVVVSLLDLRGIMQPIATWESAIINCSGVMLAIMVYLGVASWREWRHRGRSPLVVNVSPVLMLGSLAGVVWAEVMAQLWLGYPALAWGKLAVLWMFFYFLSEVFISLVMFFLIPKVLSDLRGVPIRSVTESHRFTIEDLPSAPVAEPAAVPEAVSATTPAAERPVWSDIGGQRITLADLRHIEAEGNYIRVSTTKKRMYLPGPFGPVAESLPPDLGMRVSRSDWVARDAVESVLRDEVGLRLRLTVGGEVLVPKNRRKAVLAWLEDAPAAPVAKSSRLARKVKPDRSVM